MKIFTNHSVYVQMKDITFMQYSQMAIPKGIRTRIFSLSSTFVCADENEFVEIEGEEAITFFRNLDWIIDYDLYRDLSISEMEEKVKSVASTIDALQAIDYTEETYVEKLARSEQLLHKIHSILYMIQFRYGKASIDLPEGIPYPKDYQKRKSSKQKVLSFIFRKKGQEDE